MPVWKNIFKWKKILQGCENLNAEIEVEEAAYAGFPDPLRGFIWFALLRAGQLRRSISSDYVDYLKRETTECNSSVEQTICRDLHRTFPKHVMFQYVGGLGQRSLFNVLRAYSEFDRELGYTQGMCFVVGFLLCFMQEEDCFWVFSSLMKSPAFEMRSLYVTGLPKLQFLQRALEHLMEKRFPHLRSHMEMLGIHTSAYAASWFMTLFTYSLRLPVAVRVFDLFVFKGWVALLEVALAILSHLRESILSTDEFETVLRILESEPKELTDAETLMMHAKCSQVQEIDLATLIVGKEEMV